MTKRSSDVNYTGGTNEAGNPLQKCPKSDDRGVTIRAAVFFDGTLNNRTNVELGRRGVDKGDSYSNDLSNIAVLEANWEKSAGADYCFSTYVEGIGTTDEESDCTIAAATGQGCTGIVQKVDVGIQRVITGITTRVRPTRKIESVVLDCFGFSRGAAAARHFVYAAVLRKEKTLKKRLQSMGYTLKEVTVKFIGLFDTVVSYGFNHRTNPESLHLDSIRIAEYVVQLAASDEHRKHFALTTIDSASAGIQVFLPGAHSDVGGGYASNIDEVHLQIMDLDRPIGVTDADKAALLREKEWLLRSGWYHEEEVQLPNFWNELRVTRHGISNKYSRIPLKMMASYARDRGVFFQPQMLQRFAIPTALHDIEAEIVATAPGSPEHWLRLHTDVMRKLRHDYLHFSAFYGSTCNSNEPNFTNNDPVRGRRRRRIIHG